MRLVVDASVLVAEALRVAGRAILTNPALDLHIPIEAWDETTHELRRRASILVQRGVHDQPQAAAILAETTTMLATSLTVVPTGDFADRLPEAAWRIPRDPRDVPAVALALALDCGIWTNDHDFFGCGLPVWSSDVLRSFLEHQRDEGVPATPSG
jgi:predicted nucleic acid-binding protein